LKTSLDGGARLIRRSGSGASCLAPFDDRYAAAGACGRPSRLVGSRDLPPLAVRIRSGVPALSDGMRPI
jgi:hypothetical protein